MRLTTLRTGRGTVAARVDGATATLIDGFVDVGTLLAAADWRARAQAADGERVAMGDTELGLLVTQPSKVLCVGLNYRNHIVEMGRELPSHPTVFAKFAETLTAPHAPIVAVAEDPALDWEGELAVVIGQRAERVAEDEAAAHIAGYAVANDISMRSYQNRTTQWLQGKMWARSTPIGPALVTADEFDPRHAALTTRVNGRIVQQEQLSDLLFGPAHLVAYLSTVIPLNPGDIILTGTPGGVGHARKPAEYLAAGDVVDVEITRLGALSNRIIAPVEQPSLTRSHTH